jgi:hypothetical protein
MSKQSAKPEKTNAKSGASPAANKTMFLFERKNYLFLLAGIVLMGIGFLLMAGGHQPANEFEPKEIYGFRNTTLSSIVVVAGLLVVLYSIFVKHPSPR